MNFMMKAGMNQMKDQAKALIPDEMQDKKDKKDKNKDGKDQEGQEGQEGEKSNLEPSEKGNQISQKKPKKKNPITRGLAIRMYSILLFHTLVVTIALFAFGKKNKKFTLMKLIIFLACFFGSVLFSLAVSNFKFISKIFLNYLLYLVILGANVIGFVCCVRLDEEGDVFKLVNTLFIIFDTGSLTIILFSLLVKDTPSTFWLMCSSCGGILIAVIVLAKVYNDSKVFRWIVLLFCGIGIAIYQSMNFNALDAYKKNNKNETSVPSMVSLPFELNVCFVKIFWYVIKIISYLCSMCYACCCVSAPRRKK